MTPHVSVIVPTRDRRTPLARAIASVDAQTWRDFELVVIDDASVDGTADWLRETRPDVRLIACPNPVGAAAARNLGIADARGEIIALLDDDDAWRPRYLAAQVEALAASPQTTVSFAGHVRVDPRGRVSWPDERSLLPDETPFVQLLASCPVHTSSVVAVRREAYERYGPFDESLSIVHDYEWYARVTAAGGSLVRLPETLVERGVPGGLIAQHRAWYVEESRVIGRLLSGRPREEQLVRVHRALWFARVGLERGDVGFGLERLVEAFRRSPDRAVRLSAHAVARRFRPSGIGR